MTEKGEGARLPSTTRDEPWDSVCALVIPKSRPRSLISPRFSYPMRTPYPLQTGWPLFPSPPVTLEEAGGTALLRGAAEPVRKFRRDHLQAEVVMKPRER